MLQTEDAAVHATSVMSHDVSNEASKETTANVLESWKYKH